MTEIRFYHLQLGLVEHSLPQLLEKISSIGHRIVVKLKDETATDAMNALLWTFDSNSFLPHACSKDKVELKEQPIFLTSEDENPNESKVLVLIDSVEHKEVSSYDICCEMFNGNDPEALKTARQHWKSYKEQGFDTVYYQQNDNGGWDKKA